MKRIEQVDNTDAIETNHGKVRLGMFGAFQ